MLVITIIGLSLITFPMLTLKLFLTFSINLITILLWVVMVIQKVMYKNDNKELKL